MAEERRRRRGDGGRRDGGGWREGEFKIEREMCVQGGGGIKWEKEERKRLKFEGIGGDGLVRGADISRRGYSLGGGGVIAWPDSEIYDF